MNSVMHMQCGYVLEIRDPSPAVVAVVDSLAKARAKHPTGIRSGHEGYAVILEELDEVKAEVWKNEPDRAALRKELTHVAAMAIRMIEDLGL